MERVLFRAVERGRRAKRGQLAGFRRRDQGKFTHTLPLGKAMDDCFVAYGQNGEPLRIEQGYPIGCSSPAGKGRST